ncbi:hypothetical protein BaRGS_00034098, partial [Batillaria attramentaria]
WMKPRCKFCGLRLRNEAVITRHIEIVHGEEDVSAGLDHIWKEKQMCQPPFNITPDLFRCLRGIGETVQTSVEEMTLESERHTMKSEVGSDILVMITPDNPGDFFSRWQNVGRAVGVTTDTEIASFLLQHYENTRDEVRSQATCVRCHTPLNVLCQRCSLASQPPSSQGHAEHSYVAPAVSGERTVSTAVSELQQENVQAYLSQLGISGKVVKVQQIQSAHAQQGTEELEIVVLDMPPDSADSERAHIVAEAAAPLGQASDAGVTASSDDLPPANQYEQIPEIPQVKVKLEVGSNTDYICEECGYSFANKTLWRKHVQVHESAAVKSQGDTVLQHPASTAADKAPEVKGRGTRSSVRRGRKAAESSDAPTLKSSDTSVLESADSGTQQIKSADASLPPESSEQSPQLPDGVDESPDDDDHEPLPESPPEPPQTKKRKRSIKQAQTTTARKVRKTCTTDRPYVCQTCGSAFKRNCHLTEHERIHSGVRPYMCENCSATFVRLKELNRHKQLQVCSDLSAKDGGTVRVRACYWCKETFTNWLDYKDHARGHKGDKPYQCKECSYACRIPSDLKIHEAQKHLGLRPFACSQCDQAFAVKR